MSHQQINLYYLVKCSLSNLVRIWQEINLSFLLKTVSGCLLTLAIMGGGCYFAPPKRKITLSAPLRSKERAESS
jgi:hypothetical protein